MTPSDRIFPHTVHTLNGSPDEVYFLQDFDLEIREKGEDPRIVKDDPRYLFINSNDCAQFQSWLRDKESVQTFEVSTVKSSKVKDIADDVAIKIWQDTSEGPSLSLFANGLTRSQRADKHWEFPISWFKYDESLGQAGKSNKVKLEFIMPSKESKKDAKRSSLRKNSKGTNSPSMFSMMLMYLDMTSDQEISRDLSMMSKSSMDSRDTEG